MALEVIGAGFGRTGTLSLKTALEMLGFDPCYHMLEVMQNPDHIPVWNRIAAGDPFDWEEVFATYRATTDWPACHFYAELAERYPDAKVVLSTRDPEKWYASMEKTLLKGMRETGTDSALPKDNPMYFGSVIISQGDFAGDLSKDNVIASFERHNAEVQRVIPPERLLVFQSGNGWEPLCDFLGVPVPDEPYPQTNERENFDEHIATTKRVASALGNG